MTLQDLPNSPLPQAQDYAVCLAPGSGASIVIGTYRNRSELDEDVADLKVAHRMATNTDDHGNAWLVVVEGDSVAPLQPPAAIRLSSSVTPKLVRWAANSDR